MPNARELGQMLQNYQASGNTNYNKQENRVDGLNFTDEPTELNPLADNPVLDAISQIPQVGMRHGDFSLGPLGEALMRSRENVSTQLNTPGMVEAGWGEKPRYDLRTGYYDGMNLEDARAQEQSAFWKVGNGAMKGLVTAGTTAANTVAGTVAGAAEGLFELGNQIFSNQKIDLGKVVDSAVNNRISQEMMKLQQLSEQWFPNYRTEEEQSEKYQKEWYKHIGTANFIGDSFLKNFGFTVGAIVGGAAWSSLLGKAMQLKAANNMLRGAIAAAEGDATASNALKEALNILKQTGGRADTVIPEQVLKNLSDAAKSFTKKSATLMLSGATIAAMGEGTTEGIMAKNEFLEDYMPRLEQDYAQAYDGIEKEIMEEHPEWCSYGLGVDETGRLRNDMPFLDVRKYPKAAEELAKRQSDMAREFQNIQQYAQDQGERLAGTTFLLNLPLLTLSNTIEFGRLFAGGWKSARKALQTAGGVNFENGAIRSSLERGGFSTGAIAAKNIAKVGATEAGEEMIQGVFSSGAKKVADDRLTSFNDDGYDPKQMENFGSWFRSMYKGGKDYLLDIKNWQEGFMGLVTGLIGVPGMGIAGGRWNGGVYGAINDARAEVKAEQDAIDTFNNLVNSDGFTNRWKSYIRHMKYADQMEQSALKNDEYSWHTADEKMLINDVMAFDEVGRLNDLEDLIDRYADLTSANKDEINDIRTAISKQDGIEASQISDELLANRVSEQAKKMKDTINEYREIYEDFSARVPIGTKPEQVKEMVFTATNMKAFEHRFLDMFGEVMRAIKPVLEDTARSDEAREKGMTYERLYNQFATLFSGALPQMTSIMDLLYLNNRENVFKSLLETVSFNDELKKKVNDMIKLVKDREAFYNKLIRLENMTSEEFDEQATNTTKEAEKAKKKKESEKKVEVEELEGDVAFADMKFPVMKAFYSQMSPSMARYEIKKMYSKKEEDLSEDAKKFLDLYKAKEDFIKYASSVLGSDEFGIDNGVINDLVKSLFDSAQSKDDFLEFHTERLSEDGAQDIIAALKKVVRYTDADRRVLMSGLPNALKYLGNLYMQGAKEPTKKQIEEIKSYFTGNTVVPPMSTLGLKGMKRKSSKKKKAAAPAPSPRKMDLKPSDAQPKPDKQQFHKQSKRAVETDATEMADLSDDERQVRSISQKNIIRTAFGEITSRSADKLRDAARISDREERDKALKKIEENGLERTEELDSSLPGIKSLIDNLRSREAFENIITTKKGASISFVIDPNFIGNDEDEPVIFMYDGDKCIGALPGRNRPFTNISKLIDAIYNEYEKFIESNPNQLFTFSKKTVVFGKGKGLFDFIYKDYSDVPVIGRDEQGRQTPIDGYDQNAPIIGIDRQSKPFIIRGDNAALKSYNSYFEQRYPEQGDRDAMRGNFYYLAANGVYDKLGNPEYTPIRLNVEHLKPSVFKDDTKRIVDVHQWFRDLHDRLHDIIQQRSTKNWEDLVPSMDSAIRELMPRLAELVDIHNVYFKVYSNKDTGGIPSLAVNWDNLSEDEYENATDEQKEKLSKNTKYYRINTEDAIENAVNDIQSKLLSSGHSLQINLDDEKSARKDFEELMDSGYITVNARSLHPYNVDVFLAPWDGNDFDLSDSQRKMMERNEEKNDTTPTPVQIEESNDPTISPEADEDQDFEDDGGFDFQPAPSSEQPEAAQQKQNESENIDYQQKAIDEHLNEISTALGGDGSMDSIEASKAIICAVSQGLDKGGRMKHILVNWDNMDATFATHLSEFSELMNMIFTKSEKDELAKELMGRFGVKSIKDIDMYRVLTDYNTTINLSALLDSVQTNNGFTTIYNAYKRLNIVEANKSALLAQFDYIQSVAGEKAKERNNGPTIGYVNPMDDFKSLPEDIRQELARQGHSEDEFNSSSDLMKDKMLRCAGV